MTVRTEVIFRANKRDIFVRRKEVNCNVYNLIYWFVCTGVQRPCELTVFEGHPHGSFKTTFSSDKLNSAVLLRYDTIFEQLGDRPNIKMMFYQYRDSHVKDKTIARPSYL